MTAISSHKHCDSQWQWQIQRDEKSQMSVFGVVVTEGDKFNLSHCPKNKVEEK